jgi:hypothetical protein
MGDHLRCPDWHTKTIHSLHGEFGEMKEVYIVTERYGPWTGEVTVIHKAFSSEDEADKYARTAKPWFDGYLEAIPTELD